MFFFKQFFYVFVAERGLCWLCIAVASHCSGFLCCVLRAQLPCSLWDLPGWGLEPTSLWQADTQPLDHQGSPLNILFFLILLWYLFLNFIFWLFIANVQKHNLFLYVDVRFMGLQRVGHDWATDLIWSYNFAEIVYSHFFVCGFFLRFSTDKIMSLAVKIVTFLPFQSGCLLFPFLPNSPG